MALFSLSDMKAFVTVIVSCYLCVCPGPPFPESPPHYPHSTPTSESEACSRLLLQGHQPSQTSSKPAEPLSPLPSPVTSSPEVRTFPCVCVSHVLSCSVQPSSVRAVQPFLAQSPSQNICQMNQPLLSAKHYSRCWEHRDKLSLQEPRLQRSLAPCGEMDP